jgi:hypothetical protein
MDEFANGTYAVKNALACLRAIQDAVSLGAIQLLPGGEQRGNYADVVSCVSWLQKHPQIVQKDTSHLNKVPGTRIGEVAIEHNHGDTWDYYDVHLWNGFAWVNVGPWENGTDEKTAIFFARQLTNDGDALAGEAPETRAEIMKGAFQVHPDPHHADRFSVERWRGGAWSGLLTECDPELWPWRQFSSEIDAEAAILRYSHRVGETVTLVRRDGAEIVSASPGARSFPREQEYGREQVRELVNAIVKFQVGEVNAGPPMIDDRLPWTNSAPSPVPPAPTITVFRIRPDLTSVTKQWRIQGRPASGCEFIEMFEPKSSYWEAFDFIHQNNGNFRLENPSTEEIAHWARQGFYTHMSAAPSIDIPDVPAILPPIGECRMVTRSAGDWWNVEKWTGQEWKKLAQDVTKRTAETIIKSQKMNPDKNPNLKPWDVEQRIKDLHLMMVQYNQSAVKLDAQTFISKIFKEIEKIIENNY